MSGEHEHTTEARSSLRAGTRLAGRYRITQTLPSDLLAERYRAEDEASARSVLLRVPTLEACPDDASRRKLVSALGSRRGTHGRYLGGLLDVGEDERRAFLVEPDPEGVPLSSVIAKRVATGMRFTPEEVLPVAARLAAALEALPEGMAHGELDAERVIVSADGLTLLGAGLAASLPGSALRRVVARVGVPRFAAPEWATGTIGRPADVYGLASLVVRMLVGDSEPHAALANANLGAVGVALTAMLSDEPSRRARSARALLEALARHAGLPVPDLDAGASVAQKPVARDSGGFDDESTVMMSLDQIGAHTSQASLDDVDDEDDDDLVEPREEDKTRRIALRDLAGPTIHELPAQRRGSQPLPAEPLDAEDTPADGIPLGALESAAADEPLAPLPPPRLGFTLDDAPATSSAGAATPSRAKTPDATSPSPARAKAPDAAPTNPASPSAKNGVVAAPAAATASAPRKGPLGPPPAPPVAATAKAAPPLPASPKSELAAGRPLPPPPAAPPRPRDESPPATRPDRATPVPTIDVSPLASVPESPKRRGEATRRLPTIPAPRPTEAAAPTGQWRIVGIAIAVAVLILLASVGVAWFRRHSEASARERRLRERYEELQRENTAP